MGSPCSSLRLVDPNFADGIENFLIRREKDESLLGNDFIGDADGEFAEVSLDQFSLHSEFALKHGRHPGGSGPVRRSGFAVTNGDAGHCGQYFGTLWSISSAQAVMPPLTFLRYLKPCSRRNLSAFIERTPILQWM